MAYKAQTATEYIIIVAVVLVIALVGATILGAFPGIGSDSDERVEEAERLAGAVAVDNFATTSNGTLFLLRNNFAHTVGISDISVDGNNCTPDVNLPQSTKPGELIRITCTNLNDSVITSTSPSISILYNDSRLDQVFTVTYGGVSPNFATLQPPFSGNKTNALLRDRISGYNATAFGSPLSTTENNCSWVGMFDGTDDYFEGTDLINNFDLEKNFSINFWFQVDSSVVTHNFVEMRTTGNRRLELGYQRSGARLIFRISSDGAPGGSSEQPVSITPGTWYNYGLTHNTTSGYRLYLDGTQLSNFPGSTVAGPYNLAHVGVGASHQLAPLLDTTFNYMNGNLSSIRFYQRTLNAGEVTTLNNTGECGGINAVSTQNLTTFYDFDPKP